MCTWTRSIRAWGTLVAALTVSMAVFFGCRGNFGGTQGGGLLAGVSTLANFSAIQVDPENEDSAGPQFVTAADLNNDGLMDLVSAWNQSQPVQVHLQSRTATNQVRFETVQLGGNIPAVSVAGLAISDMDQDGVPDIVVLLKETVLCDAECLDGEPQGCDVLNGAILIYFGPTNVTQMNQSLAWRDQEIGTSVLAGDGASRSAPEEGGYTRLALGDIDSDGDTDIVTAWNSACDGAAILIFGNEGPASVRDGAWTRTSVPDPFRCPPTVSGEQCTAIKDVALGDVDRDGDLDIVATYPAARSMNVRWYRNPAIDTPDDCHESMTADWMVGTVGQIEPRSGLTPTGGADAIRVGDVDRDGILDVVVRSSGGRVLQWLKGPECPISPSTATLTDPFRNIPWQVYTIAEFTERTPEAIAIADLNSDGRVEVIASAGGAIVQFDSSAASSVFDKWPAKIVMDDSPDGATDGATTINSIAVVDLDGDGRGDFLATLDRNGLSGLSSDVLLWFRNTGPF